MRRRRGLFCGEAMHPEAHALRERKIVAWFKRAENVHAPHEKSGAQPQPEPDIIAGWLILHPRT